MMLSNFTFPPVAEAQAGVMVSGYVLPTSGEHGWTQ